MNYEEVTIIITAFNVEKYISRCIESILHQTYKHIKIVVINDGSTDGTLNILQRYLEQITIYNTQNKGVANARNMGIEKVNTRFFMFVDADDYLKCNAVELLLNELQASNSDIVMGSISPCLEEKIELTDNNKYEYLFNHKIEYFMVPWNKLYKTALFKNLKYPNLKLAEDECLIHHILSKCKKVVIIPDVTYSYTHNPNSLTSKKLLFYKDMISAFADRKKFFENTMYSQKAYHQFMDFLIFLYCCMRQENNANAKNVAQIFKENYKIKTKIKYSIFYISEKMYYKLFYVRRIICRKFQ